jgi:hypothetical protein
MGYGDSAQQALYQPVIVGWQGYAWIVILVRKDVADCLIELISPLSHGQLRCGSQKKGKYSANSKF